MTSFLLGDAARALPPRYEVRALEALVGGDPLGYPVPMGINNLGQVVGYWEGEPPLSPQTGVRWDASGQAARLGNLGASPGGNVKARPFGINDSGTIVGRARRFVDGVYQGWRAVRWDAAGNAVELSNLGVSSTGEGNGWARCINASGVIGGWLDKYEVPVRSDTPVRWEADGRVTELPGLVANGSGAVMALSDSGIAAGVAYTAQRNARPVVWEASGNIRELGAPAGVTSGYSSEALGVNSAGVAVGSYYAGRYHAVWWDEAGNGLKLGGASTLVSSEAWGINDEGTIIGWGEFNVGRGPYVASGTRPVLWDAQGNMTEVYDLVDPGSGWYVREVNAINQNGCMVGTGWYNGDGSSPQYYAVLLVPVPEPGALGVMLGCIGLLLGRRRRKR